MSYQETEHDRRNQQALYEKGERAVEGARAGENFAESTSQEESTSQQYNSQNPEEVAERAMNATSDYLKRAKGSTAQTAGTINQQAQETFAAVLSEFSNNVNSMAKRLRRRDVSDALDEARGIARRNPTLMIAGGLAIGVGVALLVTSSRR